MRILRFLINQLLPHYCLLCSNITLTDHLFCAACEQDLPWQPACCPRCALPWKDSRMPLCAACLKNTFYFDRTLAALSYQPPINQWITQLKFNDQLHYANTLAQLLLTKLQNQNSHAQLIVPVPMHPSDLKKRGFNQCLLIAKYIKKHMGVPYANHLVIRKKHTAAQMSLPAKQRYTNTQGAFSVTGPLPTKHIAILDDVMTTGSTVNHIAKTLKKAGAQTIEVWVVARTP